MSQLRPQATKLLAILLLVLAFAALGPGSTGSQEAAAAPLKSCDAQMSSLRGTVVSGDRVSLSQLRAVYQCLSESQGATAEPAAALVQPAAAITSTYGFGDPRVLALCVQFFSDGSVVQLGAFFGDFNAMSFGRYFGLPPLFSVFKLTLASDTSKSIYGFTWGGYGGFFPDPGSGLRLSPLRVVGSCNDLPV